MTSVRRRIFTGIALLVVLGLGVGIGSSGNSAKTSDTKTVTSTETETVTVNAAAATNANSRHAPAACVHAIADARIVGLLAANGFSIAAKWPALISRVITAVQDQSAAEVNAVAASAKSLNRSITTETPLMSAAVAKFNRDARRCH